VGARPFHRSLGTLWRWDAELASLLALLIAVCWLLSFAMVESLRSYLRRVFSADLLFAAAALVLLGVQYLWLIQTDASPTLSSVGDYVDWMVLGSIAALSAWIALFHTACSHRENSRLVGDVLLVEATVCLAAAASRARVGGSLVAWQHFRSVMLIGAPVAAGLVVLLALAHLVERPRREPTVYDEHLFFFGPGGLALQRPVSEGSSGASVTESTGVSEGSSGASVTESTGVSEGSSGASDPSPSQSDGQFG
jgi:hypothetical protein